MLYDFGYSEQFRSPDGATVLASNAKRLWAIPFDFGARFGFFRRTSPLAVEIAGRVVLALNSGVAGEPRFFPGLLGRFEFPLGALFLHVEGGIEWLSVTTYRFTGVVAETTSAGPTLVHAPYVGAGLSIPLWTIAAK